MSTGAVAGNACRPATVAVRAADLSPPLAACSAVICAIRNRALGGTLVAKALVADDGNGENRNKS